MRILASNPDSIGDMVLRQPLYAALREAGHDVTLIVRSALVPMMPAVAPGMNILSLPADPYAATIDWNELQGLTDQATAFKPDVLLVASYQWTPFEEGLAEMLPGVRRVGMTGRMFAGDPRTCVRHESRMRMETAVEVSEETPELRKNELLCSAVLGRAVSLPRPRLEPTPAQTQLAEVVVRRFGLEPGGYWVACVGQHEYTAVRNWGTANWAEALGYWAKAYGRKFLLVGTEAESAAGQEIASAVDRVARGAAQLAGGLDLETLLGVTKLSAGYVGRDTGPMHIAAACGKPVLAVFGGGTWPRFLPAAEPSRVLTVHAPCAGCDWVCHLPESYCVKAVTGERVKKAIDDLEAGRVAGAEVEAAEPDAVLLARMVRESGRAVRESMPYAAQAKSLAQQLEEARRELAKPRQSEEDGQASAAEAAAAAAAEAAAVATRQCLEAEARAATAKRQLAAAEARISAVTRAADEFRARLSEAESEAADLKVRLAQSRTEQEVLGVSVRQVERQLRDADAELKAARAVGKRLERISNSKWHRLGRAIGLKLESARDPMNGRPAGGAAGNTVQP